MNRKKFVVSTFYYYRQEKCEVGHLLKLINFKSHHLETPLCEMPIYRLKNFITQRTYNGNVLTSLVSET